MIKLFMALTIMSSSVYAETVEVYESTDNQSLSKFERINHIEEFMSKFTSDFNSMKVEINSLKSQVSSLEGRVAELEKSNKKEEKSDE